MISNFSIVQVPILSIHNSSTPQKVETVETFSCITQQGSSILRFQSFGRHKKCVLFVVVMLGNRFNYLIVERILVQIKSWGIRNLSKALINANESMIKGGSYPTVQENGINVVVSGQSSVNSFQQSTSNSVSTKMRVDGEAHQMTAKSWVSV